MMEKYILIIQESWLLLTNMPADLTAAMIMLGSGFILVFITPLIYFFLIKKIVEKRYRRSISISYSNYRADWILPQIELSLFIVNRHFIELLGGVYERKKSKRKGLWVILQDDINYGYDIENISSAEKIFAYAVALNLLSLLVAVVVFCYLQ